MEKGFLYENIDLIFRILVWGVIGFVVFVVLLKYFGIINSPSLVSLETTIGVAVLVELARIETKLNILWTDFKKRKL